MSFFEFFRPPRFPSGKSKRATLQFRDYQVEVIRRPYRRTMTIHMKPHRPIRVTTSMQVTDHDILSFLEKKAKWIEKNQTEFENLPQALERTGEPGEVWMFKGKPLYLREAVTVLSKPFLVWGEESVTVYWPEKKWADRNSFRAEIVRLIEQSLRAEAEAWIRGRVESFAFQMKLFPRRIRFMQAQTRWGSCSSRGNVNFNWRLVGAPLEVVDAIVVHELAHLQHMNHSDDFWSLVESFAPKHKDADRWLRDNQHLL